MRLLAALWLVLIPGLVAAEATADRKAILQFGIESEVLDLVRSLRQEKSTDYNDMLVAAWANARTDEMKEALLLFFSDLKDPALEAQALDTLANAEKKANSLLLNCLTYLSEIKSTKAGDTLMGLMKGKNKVVAVAAFRTLGRLGDTSKTAELIAFYNDAETDPNFKADLIWTFGELKAPEAVDLLMKEYDDNEAQPFLRRAILEALGKIKDPRGWDKISEALNETNSDLRAAAVAALASFPDRGDPVGQLTAALRDAQAPVRLAAAQAAKTAKLPELKDILNYRVKKDPDPKVRVAALQALEAYDDGPAAVLVFLADRKTDITVWREALNLAVTKHYTGTLGALVGVLAAENKEKQSQLAPLVAGALLPQRDLFRELWGPLLENPQAASRTTAIRAIGLGRYTEYIPKLQTLADKDEDPGVRAQAKTALQTLGAAPADPAKKP